VISFFEEVSSGIDNKFDFIKDWLEDIIKSEKFDIDFLNIVFVNDKRILEINKAYLAHNYYTDVITFDYLQQEKTIQSDIFISIDTVIDNAKNFKVSYFDELLRVIIHGVLHLCGYDDATEEMQKTMRLKENTYLKMFQNRDSK
jgi:rRNA maturation RNase YbeY